MGEFMPILILGAIIGLLTLAFGIAYLMLRKKMKETDSSRNMSDKVIIRRLLQYAKPYTGKFLLVLVIFLCGVSTALGLLNIRLFRFLQESTAQETAPVHFSQSGSENGADDVYFPLGFYGREVPEFWCVYQDLPRGIYVTDVENGCDAAAKGVLPGDILTALDGETVTTAQQLTTLLETKQTPVQVTLYREGTEIELTLKIEN